MAEFIDLNSVEDRRSAILRAAQALNEGRLVGLPTETGYVLAAYALNERAIETWPLTVPLVLSCRTSAEARDFLPRLPLVGDKLLRRTWPGPLQLVLPSRVTEDGLCQSLPASALAALRSDVIRVRVPSGEVITEVGQLLNAPLLVSDESHLPCRTAAALQSGIGSAASLILNAGRPRFEAGLTVAVVQADGVTVPHAGVISAESVQRLTSDVFLFVCTGNTCRSPMAEGLFRHKLAKKLGCPESELANRGFYVASAGTSAAFGMSASPESAEILRQRGIDLSMHTSQPLTDRLLNQADFVYTMTRGHRRAVLSERPDLEARVQLLSSDGADVPDPIGGGMDEYQRCQQAIERYLDVILAGIQPRKQ